MTVYNTIGFPPAIGLPGTYNGVPMNVPPNVDGFREDEPGLAGVALPHGHQLEGGYNEGGRVAYGGAAGVPVAVIDCIKDPGSDFIYLSLVSRYDPSFDDDDFVVVMLRPNGPGAANTNDLRIDVHPVLSGAGAPTLPSDSNDFNVGTSTTPEIRTNKPPHLINFYKRTGAPHIWGDLGSTPNVTAKVRSVLATGTHSWSVELKIPTTAAAGGAGWHDLGTTFGLYVSIGQAFTSGGIEQVTQFTWPYDSADLTAYVLADNDPTDTLETDWDAPGFGTASIVARGANPELGVNIVGGAAGVGILDGSNNVQTVLDMTLNHVNKFVARVQNTSTEPAPGIVANFRISDFGLSGGAWNASWNEVPAAQNPTAGVTVPPMALPTDHTDIQADWTIGNADRTKYGALSTHQCVWAQLSTNAGSPVPIVDESEFNNLSIQNLSTAQPRAVIDAARLHEKLAVNGSHQVILQVASNKIGVAASGHTPIETYMSQIGHPPAAHVLEARAMPVAAAMKPSTSIFSRLFGRAPVTGPISPIRQIPVAQPVATTDVPFIQQNPLLSGAAALEPYTIGPRRFQPFQVVSWHTVVIGYQGTGRTLTRNGKKRRVMVYAGSYGYLARHVLGVGERADNVTLVHQLAPTQGLVSLGGNMYQAMVGLTQPLQLASTLKTQTVGAWRFGSFASRLTSVFRR